MVSSSPAINTHNQAVFLGDEFRQILSPASGAFVKDAAWSIIVCGLLERIVVNVAVVEASFFSFQHLPPFSFEGPKATWELDTDYRLDIRYNGYC